MPLTEAEERAEHLLRMDQMTVSTERLRQEIRTENRRFLVSALLAIAAAVAAGVALGRFWLFHQ
jgi:hypothetical protein